VSPRTGRPKAENPKSTQLAVRIDDELLNKLDTLAKKMNVTRVQVIRLGIEKLYEEKM
jgi:predicted transcriptional regulator